MPLGLLEQRLGELDPSLWEDLDAVKDAMRRVWDEFKGKDWFPDYGIEHSERIISMIQQILMPIRPGNLNAPIDSMVLLSDMSPVPPLTGDELYVLLAACYVHDVGLLHMFYQESQPNDLSVDSYINIENLHPQKSYEVIRDSAKDVRTGEHTPLGLRNDGYLELVALVTKAHSTETFEDTIQELQKCHTSPKEEEFRGELLAALLMVSDQLDVTRKRERVSNLTIRNAASLLYNLSFSYVREVRVLLGNQPLMRRVKIWFELPPHPDNKEENHALQIHSWVLARVKKHCHKARRVFREFAGGLDWEDRIEDVLLRPSQFRAKGPNTRLALLRKVLHDRQAGGAILLLRKLLYDQRIVDRTDLRKKLADALESDYRGFVTILCPEHSDQELVMDWFEALCKYRNRITLIRLTLNPERSADREGIMERIALRLDQKAFGDFWQRQKELDQDSKIKRWSERLPHLEPIFHDCLKSVCSRLELKPIIVVENVHLLKRTDKNWLRWSILKEIQNLKVTRPPVMVLLFSDSDTECGLIFANKERCVLQRFTVDQVREHFQQVLGYSQDVASTEAQKIVDETNGVPSLVLGQVDYKWMEHVQVWEMLK